MPASLILARPSSSVTFELPTPVDAGAGDDTRPDHIRAMGVPAVGFAVYCKTSAVAPLGAAATDADVPPAFAVERLPSDQ